MKKKTVMVKAKEKIIDIYNSPYFKPTIAILALIGSSYLLYKNETLKNENEYLNNVIDCVNETNSNLFIKNAAQKDTINKLSSDLLRNGSPLGGIQMNKLKQEKISNVI